MCAHGLQGPCRRSLKRIVLRTQDLITITALAATIRAIPKRIVIASYTHGPKRFYPSLTTCRPPICDTEPCQSPIAAVVRRQTRVGDVEVPAKRRLGEVNGTFDCSPSSLPLDHEEQLVRILPCPIVIAGDLSLP